MRPEPRAVDETTILAAAGAGIVLILGYLAMSGGSGANEKRKNAIVNNGKPEKAGLFSFLKSEDNSNRRKQIEASLGDLEMRTKDKEKARKTLKSKLIQADWSMTAQTFTIISVILGVLTAAGAFFAKAPLPVVGGIGVVVGFGLPRWFLSMIVTRRQKQFTEHFSDAMDIIVRGVRTGLPLGDCLKIIAHESPEQMLREKIKALAAEAKASAMIIGALPPGVMVLVTMMAPDYMTELYTTKTGHRNLMIGAAMMVSGTLVMRKMINFKI